MTKGCVRESRGGRGGIKGGQEGGKDSMKGAGESYK